MLYNSAAYGTLNYVFRQAHYVQLHISNSTRGYSLSLIHFECVPTKLHPKQHPFTHLIRDALFLRDALKFNRLFPVGGNAYTLK